MTTSNEVLEENRQLKEALENCSRHFALLLRLSEAERIGDDLKRPKWKIVRDEAEAGMNYALGVLAKTPPA